MQQYLLELSGVIVSITTIGGALIWVYKKLVTEPDRKMAEKIQEKYTRELGDTIQPLASSIENLSRLLEESQKDREYLHKKDKHQDKRLDNHETRITVIEDWRSVVERKDGNS